MTLLQRVQDKARALLQIHGTGKIKQALWNTEFAKENWACLDETSGDIVYFVIDKWAHGGSGGKYRRIVELLEKHFKIIDNVVSRDSSALVMVFRPFGPQ